MTTSSAPAWRDLTNDTSMEAEAVQFALFRSTPPWRKLAILHHHSLTARRLAEAGLRRRHLTLSPTALKVELFALLYCYVSQ